MGTLQQTVTHPEVREMLEELHSGLKRLYRGRLRRILLYGSWAKGEATADSDVDVAVVLADSVVPGEEIDRMLDLVVDIGAKYDTLISVYPVSEEKYLLTRSPLLINVRREGLEL